MRITEEQKRLAIEKLNVLKNKVGEYEYRNALEVAIRKLEEKQNRLYHGTRLCCDYSCPNCFAGKDKIYVIDDEYYCVECGCIFTREDVVMVKTEIVEKGCFI